MGGVEPRILVGKVVRPHGIRGEVKVISLTERIDRIVKASRLFLQPGEEDGKWIDVQRGRIQGKYIILKLAGIDDRNTAEHYRNTSIQMPLDSSPSLPKDTYYTSSLIGLKAVTNENQEVGEIIDVLNTPGQDVLVIQSGEREILIPAVKQFIEDVDIEGGFVVITWMEGLW